MSIKPLTERQQTLIVNNVVKATKDISKLNKIGYKFINLASGFIAHYNLYGFIDYYMNHDLEEDILRNKNANMWDNFRPGFLLSAKCFECYLGYFLGRHRLLVGLAVAFDQAQVAEVHREVSACLVAASELRMFAGLGPCLRLPHLI
jgi:hypothetical protein